MVSRWKVTFLMKFCNDLAGEGKEILLGWIPGGKGIDKGMGGRINKNVLSDAR